MELKENQSLVEGQRVKIYLNPHKMGRFSIEDCQTGIVVAYADSILLKDAQFIVDKQKQEQAKIEGSRNIHAFVIGSYVVTDQERPKELSRQGYYNPFHVDTFVNEETREPLHSADLLYCHNKRVYF